MARRDHPEAGRSQDAEAVEIVIKRLGALDAEERPRDRRVRRAASEVGLEATARLDNGETPRRLRGHLAESEGEVERPREPTAPRRPRPALAERQERDEVWAIVVAVHVRAERHLGRRGQADERDTAVDQARDVEVAVRGAA